MYDYKEAEIVRKTGLTPKTVSKELENLRNEDIAKITRKIGRSNMYSLNQSIEVKGRVISDIMSLLPLLRTFKKIALG